jgi:hypothetical protein
MTTNLADIKLMIATPMYGGQCTAHFAYYNIELAKLAVQYNLTIRHEFITTESLITRGRNGLANIFLDSGFTHMLFIDADISFDPKDVFKMLSHNKLIVCGGYPIKGIDWNSIETAVKNNVPADKLQQYASPLVYNKLPGQLSRNGLIEVSEAGTGFMMIKREVYERLADKVPSYISNQYGANAGVSIKEFFSTSINNGVLLSEDYHFCKLWRKYGGKIFVDTTVKLHHIGPYVF